MEQAKYSSGRARLAATKGPKYGGALILCLLLIPHLLLLRVVSRAGQLGKSELDDAMGRAYNFATLFIVPTILCISWLLTDGARPRAGAGQATAPGTGCLGLLRILGLAFVLGAIFIVMHLVCSLLTVLLWVPGGLVTFLLGIGTALGVSGLLLDYWGFAIGSKSALRFIASAAYGVMLACWAIAAGVAGVLNVG
jgi:hypothetical protein